MPFEKALFSAIKMWPLVTIQSNLYLFFNLKAQQMDNILDNLLEWGSLTWLCHYINVDSFMVVEHNVQVTFYKWLLGGNDY